MSDGGREQEIQARLDAGQPAGDDAEATAYSRLYRELSRSTARLPTSFACVVMQRILEARIARKESLGLLVSLGLGLGSLAAGVAAVMLVTSQGYAPDLSWPVFDTLASLPSASVYGVIAIVSIVAIDIVVSQLRDRGYNHSQ